MRDFFIRFIKNEYVILFYGVLFFIQSENADMNENIVKDKKDGGSEIPSSTSPPLKRKRKNENNLKDKHDGESEISSLALPPRKRKRGMKPRSQRKRQRARSEAHSISDQTYEINVAPLELDGKPIYDSTVWLRTVEPYPYTFTTYAKARWIGRTILDVYHTEFGSYPKSYYESAITQGRILLSDKKVNTTHLIKGNDVLSHTVHRHEPSVVVYSKESPYIRIVEETDDVVVIDKPGTLPVHPCGGYHIQSLMNILTPKFGKLYTIHRLDRLTSGLVILGKNSPIAQQWGKCIMKRDCQKIYLAKVAGKFPLNCSLSTLQSDPNTTTTDASHKGVPLHGEWENHELQEDSASTLEEKDKVARQRNAHGIWITDASGEVQSDVTLDDVFNCQHSEEDLLEHLKVSSEIITNACPTRIVQPKDGICLAGKFDELDKETYVKKVKPAQTSFSVVRYDENTDSTIVLCQPTTGRTHQIRLHLQYLGHPIGNDPNYGGNIWYGNPIGQKASTIAEQRLNDINIANQDEVDRLTKQHDDGNIILNEKDQSKSTEETTKTTISNITTLTPTSNTSSTVATTTTSITTNTSTNTSNIDTIMIDVPATEDEIQNRISKAIRNDNESIHDFIKRTCVWCARSRIGGSDRTILEMLIRSPGIWLHALQYSFPSLKKEGKDNTKMIRFCTTLPSWSTTAATTTTTTTTTATTTNDNNNNNNNSHQIKRKDDIDNETKEQKEKENE